MKVWAILAIVAAAGVSVPPASPVVVTTGVAEEAMAANSQPKLTRDKQGTIYLVFVKPIDGTDQVFLASSADQGHRWRAEVVTHSTAASRYPTLAVGPEGTIHVAWTQYDSGIGSVYYAHSDGQRWATPVRLSEGTAYAGIPALAIAAQGRPHIVWYGIRAQAPTVQTRHGSLYEILYTTATTSRWTPPVIISPGIPDSINPTLGIDSRGRLHSAWYQYDLRAYQVRHTTRDQTWSSPEQVSQGEDASDVAMALDRTDVVYLVWERHEPSGTRIYFAERIRQWSAQQPLSAAGDHAANPSIAVDDRGTVYVAWANAGAIYLTRRIGQWLGVDRVQTEGSSDHPILAASGRAVDLVWTQQVGGDRRLMFVSLAAGGPLASTPSPVWPVILVISIGGFLIMTLWQWRKRQRSAWGGFWSPR